MTNTKSLALKLVTVAVVSVFAAGCATSPSGSNYSAADAQHGIATVPAWVVSSRPVTIDNPNAVPAEVAGVVIGAVLGNIIGRSIGSGHGETIARGVGTVGGAAGGYAAANALTKIDGVEITVRMRSGAEQTLVQAADKGITFPPGMPVRLSYANGKARVAPAPDSDFGPMPAASPAAESVAPQPQAREYAPPAPVAYAPAPVYVPPPSQGYLVQGPAGPYYSANPPPVAPVYYVEDRVDTFPVTAYQPYAYGQMDVIVVLTPSGQYREMRVPHEGARGGYRPGDRVRFETRNGTVAHAHHVER